MSAIFWFAIWAVLIFLMMRFGCGAHVMGHGQRQGNEADGGEPRWVPPESDADPVCGKSVKTADAKSSVFKGLVYYFCSRECREVFEAAPHVYAKTNGDGSMKQLGDSHA